MLMGRRGPFRQLKWRFPRAKSSSFVLGVQWWNAVPLIGRLPNLRDWKETMRTSVLRTCFLVGLLGGATACKSARRPASAVLRDGSAPTSVGVVTRAKECIEAMGFNDPTSPNFVRDFSLPEMSCLAGQEIPVRYSRDGKEQKTLDKNSWDDFFGLTNQGAPLVSCDAPHWLSGVDACYPYDFVQVVETGAANVTAILNCRQKYFPKKSNTTGTEYAHYFNAGMNRDERLAFAAKVVANPDATEREKKDAWDFATSFDDLGLLFRDRVTGKTCFFSTFDKAFFGGWLPAPDQDGFNRPLPNAIALRTRLDQALGPEFARLSESEVFRPGDIIKGAGSVYLPKVGPTCVRCHASGFKWSPFMSQVSVVPSPVRPRGSQKDVPFLPVGADQVEAFYGAKHLEVAVTADGRTPTGECTRCHRITSTFSRIKADGSPAENTEVVGVTEGRWCAYPVDESIGIYSKKLAEATTPAAKAVPYMPEGNALTLSEHRAKYGRYLGQLKCCCSHPTARGCLWRRYGPTPEEVDEVWHKGPRPDLEQRWRIGADTGSCRDARPLGVPVDPAWR